MKYSVLIPVYNAETYLKECIESVLAQDFCDYEIILVDDGSTDSSYEICRLYAQKYSFIKAFTKINEGQLATRLFALLKAKGEYVLFLDADDEYEPKLMSTLNAYNINNDIDLIFFRWKKVDENGNLLLDYDDRTDPILVNGNNEIARIVFFNELYNSMCIKCIRRSIIRTENVSGLFHIRHGEDLIQTAQIIKNCNKALFISDSLYLYRLNKSSVTHQPRLNTADTIFELLDYVLNCIKTSFSFSTNEINKYYLHCKDIIYDAIITAIIAKEQKNTKICYLRSISNNPFYKDHLLSLNYSSRDLKRRIILFLFDKGRYSTLIILGKIYERISKA